MSHQGPARPLSPHLQVYSWGLHMALSMLHRATGVALTAGMLLLAWWLLAIAAGPVDYETFRALAAHPIGRLVLFGFTFALVYHLLNGIRHLYWDTGAGLSVQSVSRSGLLVVLLTLLLTLGAWAAAYHAVGAL